MSNRSVVLPIVPMFHANSWGIPFAAATVGAKLVFSATNDAQVLCDLMHDEGVTHSAGVPTVWIAMFAHMDATGMDYGALRHVVIGGSAAPRAMIERFMKAGVYVRSEEHTSELPSLMRISYSFLCLKKKQTT